MVFYIGHATLFVFVDFNRLCKNDFAINRQNFHFVQNFMSSIDGIEQAPLLTTDHEPTQPTASVSTGVNPTACAATESNNKPHSHNPHSKAKANHHSRSTKDKQFWDRIQAEQRQTFARRVVIGWVVGITISAVISIPSGLSQPDARLFSVSYGDWGLILAIAVTLWPLLRLVVVLLAVIAHRIWDGYKIYWKMLRMIGGPTGNMSQSWS